MANLPNAIKKLECILFLTGDDLYPDLNDPEGIKDRDHMLQGTVKELRKRSTNLHRYERRGYGKQMIYICNIVLPHGYRIPKVEYNDSRL